MARAIQTASSRSSVPATAPRVLQPIELRAKLADILKAAVDGGEAHVGHLVQLMQLVHDQLADLARRQLAVSLAADRLFDLGDRRLDLLGAHGTFLQGTQLARAELRFIILLAAAVALDDPRHHYLVGVDG